MTKRLQHPLADDFEALIRIFTTAEGGRQFPPFNGIRWDFSYADDPPDKQFMIYPYFYDERGDSLPTDKPLPLGVEIPARMVVLNDKLRTTLHRSRITEGTRFYCHEGVKRVAEGRVTRLTGLFAERARPGSKLSEV